MTPSTTRRAGAALTILAAVAAALSGCGSSSGAEPGGDAIAVVASTDVYGDIAKRIGGDAVSVTSIIQDASQDPHSYEASARTTLALSRADVVVKNGGGYDDFVTKLLAGGSDATVVDAVTVSGRTAPAGGELNEHVWYDFPSMRKLADRLASVFAAADKGAAATFRANADRFDASLADLEATEATIAKAHRGAGAAITEPVPLYLLEACGLVDRTPAAFSEAVEEGDDVPVGVLNTTLNLFRDKKVALLAYNEQTTGAVTDKVEAAAKAAGIPVVPVTETLPAGKNYLGWMQENLAAVEAALD